MAMISTAILSVKRGHEIIERLPLLLGVGAAHIDTGQVSPRRRVAIVAHLGIKGTKVSGLWLQTSRRQPMRLVVRCHLTLEGLAAVLQSPFYGGDDPKHGGICVRVGVLHSDTTTKNVSH